MTATILTYFGTFLVISIVLIIVYKAEAHFGKMTKLTIAFLSVWHIGSYFLARSGYLLEFSTTPPRILPFLPLMVILSVVFALSKHGKLIVENTSIWILIGIQSFRFIPEFMLDLSYREGLAPVQMTYYGRNFDILAAVLAMVIFFISKYLKGKERLVGSVYTFIGLGLLFNILATAVLSMPTSFRYFMNDPANTFVATSPYHFLPFSMVFLALWLHVLIIRKALIS